MVVMMMMGTQIRPGDLTGDLRLWVQVERVPGHLEIDVWVLVPVCVYCLVEVLLADVTPRADGVREGLNRDGESRSHGFESYNSALAILSSSDKASPDVTGLLLSIEGRLHKAQEIYA